VIYDHPAGALVSPGNITTLTPVKAKAAIVGRFLSSERPFGGPEKRLYRRGSRSDSASRKVHGRPATASTNPKVSKATSLEDVAQIGIGEEAAYNYGESLQATES